MIFVIEPDALRSEIQFSYGSLGWDALKAYAGALSMSSC